MRGLTWALVLGLAACGDDDGGSVDASSLDATVDAGALDGATDAGGGALADLWCPDFAARVCAASSRCDCAAIPGFGDEAACLERAERTCRVQLARFAEEPRLELASAVPEGCAAALDEALVDCRMPENDTFAVRCPLAWPRDVDRTLPSTGACVEGLCAEGARCSSEGECAMPTADAACGSIGDCPDGDRCGEDGTCRGLDLGGSGTSCTGPEACGGDLRCLAATRRECVAKEAGGPCVGDEACVEGEYCAEGTCTTSPGLGAACGNGTACAADLACRASDGTCRAFPTTGQPCALGALGPFLCAEGLACREGICGAIPTEGETCATGDVRCAEGLGCHFEADASVCRPRVGVGAACGLDDTCEAGLFCDFGEGRCAAVLAEGAICRDGNECGPEGACVPDETATTFRCVPRPSEGEACFLDDTCEAGFVCRSPFDAGVCAPPVCSAFVF